MSDKYKFSAPDLTKRPPRSPRCRLGGYVILPRMLDKGRATIAGTNGEFNYDAPFDQHIVSFLGFDMAALREQLTAGRGDGEIMEWINAHARHKRAPWKIEQWSDYLVRRGPDSDEETLTFSSVASAYFPRRAKTSGPGWTCSISMTL